MPFVLADAKMESARFPAAAVARPRIALYASTWPSLRATQYQRRRPSNAPRRAVNARTEGLERNGSD